MRALVLVLAPVLMLSIPCCVHGAVRVVPWGRNSFRVRISPPGVEVSDSTLTALLPNPTLGLSQSMAGTTALNQTNGNLRVEPTATGGRQFVRVSDGAVLLVERVVSYSHPLANQARPQLAAEFGVGSAELYGFGQQRQACYAPGGVQTQPLLRLFVPGAAVNWTLARGEGGAANTLPWLTAASPSDRGAQFGFWLNTPAMGTVLFNATSAEDRSVRWALAAAAQLDYLVTTASAEAIVASRAAFELLENFVSWVGQSPGLPDWALGYWHSKNRYGSQRELLDAAWGFRNRSIPVDIIVVDWLHWKVQGDWHFDPEFWPDPTAMVSELRGLGMELMVTVWPFSHNGSVSYDRLLHEGWVTRTLDPARPDPAACLRGTLCPPGVITLPDALHGALVDVTQPAARRYVWSVIEDGYYKHGIRTFWLDAAEPEDFEFPQWGQVHWPGAGWGAGTVAELGQLFALLWTQALQDGLRANGETTSVLLPRGGYAGSWRHGAGLWSGDIWCTFEVLRGQVRTGLSAQTSGFGLWTTDIGGYSAAPDDRIYGQCDPGNANYAELVTRWFQFGATCPIFRQHGARQTEVWKYGLEAEANIVSMIRWRASLKPYLAARMRALNKTGEPLNRPVWWDFPSDPAAWELDDQYMMGPAYLVAPVLELGVRSRLVYLPKPAAGSLGPNRGVGAPGWRHVFSGVWYPGGQAYNISTPLSHFPVFQLQSSQ